MYNNKMKLCFSLIVVEMIVVLLSDLKENRADDLNIIEQ